jgi:hypothetical protein
MNHSSVAGHADSVECGDDIRPVYAAEQSLESAKRGAATSDERVASCQTSTAIRAGDMGAADEPFADALTSPRASTRD